MSLPTTSEVACRVCYITQSKDFSLRPIKYAPARRPINYERRDDRGLTTVPRRRSTARSAGSKTNTERTDLYQRASMRRRCRQDADDAEKGETH